MGICTTSSAGGVTLRGPPQKSWPFTSSIGNGKPLAPRAVAPDVAAGCEPCGLGGPPGAGVAPGATASSPCLNVTWMLSLSSPTLHREWHRASVLAGHRACACGAIQATRDQQASTAAAGEASAPVAPPMHVEMTETGWANGAMPRLGEHLLPR